MRNLLNGHSFFTLNDVVMGGRSSSSLSSLSDGSNGLSFTGTINTNGGGFASCRTDKSVLPVVVPDEATTVELEVKGDGKLYKFILNDGSRGGPRSSSPSFQHDVMTRGDWQVVQLPLRNFKPSFAGSSRPAAGALVNREMNTGFMLSLKNAAGEPNPHFGQGVFDFEFQVRSMVFR